MKRTGQAISTKRMKIQNLTAANKEKQPPVGRSKQGSKKDLLLRHPNFVAKSTDASFEAPPLACEASALTTELTAQNQLYFTPKNQLCKHKPLIPLASGLKFICIFNA
jgi:hypothetical protein